MKVYIEKLVANYMNVWKKGHGSYSGACSNFALHYGVSFAMSFCGALATLGQFTDTDIFESYSDFFRIEWCSLERFNSALAVIVPFVVFFIVLYSFLKYKDRYLRLSEKYDICDPIKDLINFLKSFIPVVVLAICLIIATSLRG
ncbi:MAG: hypothetical protein IKQ08_05640 [Paludibacteraceae bacterium]|nr:hypothetical protein [Paludibacteraceae bacterium]